MQLRRTALYLLAIASTAIATTAIVTYSPIYDEPNTPTSSLACPVNGGGLPVACKTLSCIPAFPLIGGSDLVSGAGWNDPECGTCWTLSYEGNSVNILVLDTASVGFNISQEAFEPPGGQAAVEAGSLVATIQQTPASECGL